jgi:polysaccharide export outer membrane protein
LKVEKKIKLSIIGRMFKRLIVWAVSVQLCAACSSFPKVPAYPEEDPGFAEPKRVARPGLKDDPPLPLVLLPGDVIRLETVSTTTEVREGVVVDATGCVHVPLAGDIDVKGLGLTVAETEIQKALQRFDRAVHVNLQLIQAAGHRVTVVGAVRTPGRVDLVPGARIADVIASVGGPLTADVGGQTVVVADLDGGVLIRDGKRVPINLVKALEGKPMHNIYAHPGDHIYLPSVRGGTISVIGQVGHPVVFPYRKDIRLTEALALGGGITVGGDKTDIRIVRGPLSSPQVYQASLRDIVDGKTHDAALYPGDIVYVTDHVWEDISEVIGPFTGFAGLVISAATLGLVADRQTTTSTSN